MLPVVTPAEMAEVDRRAVAAGTPESVLIDRAGRALALQVRRALGGVYGRRAVVVCGKGNNGADGRVAARLLRHWGVGVLECDLDAGIDRARLERALEVPTCSSTPCSAPVSAVASKATQRGSRR
jgi:NAD(P)H-hydrate epimerase